MKFRVLIFLFLICFSINLKAQTFYEVPNIHREKIYEDELYRIYLVKLKSTDSVQIISNDNQYTILECWTEWILKKPEKYKNTFISLTKQKDHIKYSGFTTTKKIIDYNAKGEVVESFDMIKNLKNQFLVQSEK